MSEANIPLLIILGPTASGKTQLAVQVAEQLDGAILSADSRQVYKDMNIGTGKDLHEYQVNGRTIPYYLINIREAGEQYHVHDFQHDFEHAYHEIASQGRCPVVCGGSGFYLYALLTGHGYTQVPVNAELRDQLETLANEELLTRFQNLHSAYRELADTSTRKRLIRSIEISEYLIENPALSSSFTNAAPPYPYAAFGLNPAVETRRARITARLEKRLQEGLIEEVQSLLASGLTADQLIYYGLEYKYITQYLTGTLTYAEMRVKLETEIHRFAKRQMTFFRKMEKDGISIQWLPGEADLQEQTEWITSRYKTFVETLR
ncbi:tRNA (adenosine(37)-N6)-dimethylallyltransferase MiaA [Dyadobacter sandarakinus]|uniref:tRNA dimethylallyltransferase n=2 Tax=Dyadobacter sandarakinus TaxID=2747268 RepID=A0ABX7IE66_9BACT|nr:tRNA (adenosine(37)-N6)-dimethylallyltransferase MiaA [Dyadobacter sandarakinus]